MSESRSRWGVGKFRLTETSVVVVSSVVLAKVLATPFDRNSCPKFI